MNELLSSGLAALHRSTEAADTLARYGQLLLEQNQVMNLTAITDPADVARLHMLDSAALLNAADFRGKAVLDVGTGAGFPGMVLKILEPSVRLTLLDSLDKRIQWLRALAPQLNITQDFSAVHGRAEELARQAEYREQFDLVTSRAVADLRMLCELCLPFVKVGGLFLAMKSTDSRAEVDAAGRAISLLGGALAPAVDYTIPGTDITHRIILVQKLRPSSERYPRRFAKIRKSPL